MRYARNSKTREEMKMKEKRGRQLQKYKCEHAKRITEVLVLALFLVMNKTNDIL